MRITARSTRTVVVAACAAAALVAGGVGVAQAAPGEVVVPDSVTAAVTSAPVVGDVPATRNFTVQVWLAGDTSGATTFADAVSNPHSPTYHHYLSPQAYTARYGASTADTDTVRSWLDQQGFTGVTVDPQRNYIQASAPTATVQNAFQVRMKTFKVATRSTPLTSNDRDITLPASIAKLVSGVTGLDNTQAGTGLAAPQPQPGDDADNCSNYYGQHTQTVAPFDGVTSLPTHICGYTGAQLRAVYGMNNANTGKGVTVAYIEIGTPYKMAQTLATWAAANGLPAPKSQTYSELSIGAGSECSNLFDFEEQMDVEAGFAMAPDQHELLVGGDSCLALNSSGPQSLLDAENTVLDGNGNHPLATITSNSWVADFEQSTTSPWTSVMHTMLLRAAGEGVGVYLGSGDANQVFIPSDDPYAISVGGTTLGIDANNKRIFETGWSVDLYEVNSDNTYTADGLWNAAGGGASTVWSQPAYQQGVVPASMASPGGVAPARTGPDISALADATTGMQVDVTDPPDTPGDPDVFRSSAGGGTSLATPLVAGMVAAAQQGRPTSFGFINPVLYALSGSKAYNDPLPLTASTPVADRAVYCAPSSDCQPNFPSVWTFDDQDPANTKQVTAKGYDTMTGLGTPNGQPFITALRRFD